MDGYVGLQRQVMELSEKPGKNEIIESLEVMEEKTEPKLEVNNETNEPSAEIEVTQAIKPVEV